jgi:phosphoribosylformimino-5-aminoimidazole carboxamide ribotide isomerase
MLKRWGKQAVPAIDILGGRVVRLHQGRYDRVTVYADDPVAVAEALVSDGASRLHVVDLDAARDGARPAAHSEIIARISALPGARVQLGGGIRTEADVAAALETGAWRVVVGTLAADEPETAGRLARETGRLVAAIDCRDGTVRVRGWAADSGADPVELVRRLVDAGVRDIAVTAIERDGTGAGLDARLISRMRPAVPGELIAAGGVYAPVDVTAAVGAGADLVIVGRALYEDGGFDLA